MSDSQIYQCHKQVKATAMTRQEYNDYHGWELPSDESGADEGFLVEYLDGGESNHPNHDGYISWSPKAVFESGYRAAPTDFIDRLRLEESDLQQKLSKLFDFIHSEKSHSLDEQVLSLMVEQVGAMVHYHEVLKKRIDLHG